MIKIKLTGLLPDLQKALAQLRQTFEIINIGNAVKNRNSLFHRTYVTVDFYKKEEE